MERCKWFIIHMGVSLNGGTPSEHWMVYFMENPHLKWMIWGYPHFRKSVYMTHISSHTYVIGCNRYPPCNIPYGVGWPGVRFFGAFYRGTQFLKSFSVYLTFYNVLDCHFYRNSKKTWNSELSFYTPQPGGLVFFFKIRASWSRWRPPKGSYSIDHWGFWSSRWDTHGYTPKAWNTRASPGNFWDNHVFG